MECELITLLCLSVYLSPLRTECHPLLEEVIVMLDHGRRRLQDLK